jgi:signal transduction histidine kinase/CheY-like chemotaxis protein
MHPFSFRTWPLSRQLLGALGGSVLITGMISGELVRDMETTYLEQTLEQQNRRTLSLLSATSLDAIVSEDRPLLETIVAQTVSYEADILSLSVLNELGEPLVQWQSKQDHDQAQVRRFQKDVVFEGESFGSIRIQWNVQNLFAKIDRHVQKMRIFGALLFVVLGLAILLWINKLVVHPIKLIHRKLVELERDEAGEPLQLRSAQELTRLSGSVNALGEVLELKQRREAELEEASRAKSDFLANMSHELRTPMNGVLGMLSLLRDTPMTEQQSQWADVAANSGRTLLALINDVLDFSKIEAGRLELEEIDMSVRLPLEDSMELLAEQAHAKRLELSCIIDQDVPDMVSGDPTRLRQVITNLLANAVKFTETGEVILKVSKIGDVPGGAMLKFSVSDTGVGIAADSLAKIFESFSQADDSTTRRYGGSGLGLAISKHLVEQMGGEIDVESTPGIGTTFTFTMLAGTARHPAPAHKAFTALRTRHVLVIDDNAGAREAVSGIVKGWGALCDAAPDIAQAVELIDQARETGQPFDAILIDIASPDGDRDALADGLSAHHQGHSRIILMTSFLSQDSATSTPGGQAICGRLRKPVRAEALRTCMSRALGLEGTSDTDGVRKAFADDPARRSLRHAARVLVVEDNEVNQAVVMSMLEKLEYQATVVDNGVDALQLLEREEFNLVLMDCQMPGMDGYETTQRIRERERLGDTARLPVIALTANAMAGDAQRCIDAGMDDYLPKPFEATALERTLDDWILGSLQPAAPATGATAPATGDAGDGASERIDDSELPVRRAL